MLPMPPSANRYWKIIMLPSKGLTWPLLVPNVRAIWKYFRAMNKLSDEAETYKADLLERFNSGESRPRMSSSALCVDIVVCFATNARQDIDNRVKPLLDALQAAGVMEDDTQIVDLRVRRGPVIKGGRVVVRVWEVVPNFDRALYSTGWGKLAAPSPP
jgi:crossover junction endodeoxyribonuclease RusA